MGFNFLILLLTMLILLISCGKGVNNVRSEKGLSEQERQYLRERTTSKCMEDSESHFKKFEGTSNDKMLKAVRNDHWKIELKKGSDVTPVYINVWKVVPPHIYYRIKVTENGLTLNKYLKLDTTTNIEMLRNLQKYSCTKKHEISVGSSLSLRILGSKDRVDNETEIQNEVTYKIQSEYPAYFGVFTRTQTKKTLNNSGTVTKTEAFDYVISKNTNELTQPVSYKDSTITNPRYCMIKYSAPVPPEKMNVYSFPFTINCTEDDEAGPDINGDTIPDFDPAVEL